MSHLKGTGRGGKNKREGRAGASNLPSRRDPLYFINYYNISNIADNSISYIGPRLCNQTVLMR
jgi:hypothetical protein